MNREKQDDWKRTQLRMPQGQYDAVMRYAEENNLSLNTAMLDLMDKGLNHKYIDNTVMTFDEYKNVIDESMEKHMKAIHDQIQAETYQKLIKQNSRLLDEIITLKEQLNKNSPDK